MAIRVLVVDDSAFMRKVISEILNEQEDIEVVGTARNGLDALKKLERFDVDVMTLDLEMPVLDGLETIKRVMSTKPLPILVLSGVTEHSFDITMKALSSGAVDFIAKPSGNISLDLHKISHELTAKIRSLADIKLTRPAKTKLKVPTPHLKVVKPLPLEMEVSKNIVAIGSSTGGPRALEKLFMQLPAHLNAGILVIQHMPKNFTRSLAARLNSLSSFTVKEASDGDYIKDGQALVAPGDFHLIVDNQKRVRLNQEPPVKYLRPAIDVTMLSLPNVFKNRVVGVILTGMGNDGAKGMAAIKQNGGYTITQDKATSTIYSMPRAVYNQGNADYVLPIEQIANCIVKLVNEI